MPITKQQQTILYASVQTANLVAGGHHSYATIAERDNIPTSLRRAGMLVTVYGETDVVKNNTYVLKSDLVEFQLPTDSAGVDKTITGVRALSNRTRVFYSGTGINANTLAADGLSQALGDAQPGDFVQQVTPIAVGGLLGNSQQILIKSGVNYNTGGFNIDATAGSGDAITLQGGTGVFTGNNAIVKNSGSGSWGIGWYSATNINYKLYDLHFEVSVGNAFLITNGKIFHTGSVTGTSSLMIVVRTSTYEHVGNITVNAAATAFYADRTNSKVINTGDITLTAADSKLGIITTSSTVELRNGVLDLTAPGTVGAFKIDSTSSLILKDVTVIGSLPAKAFVAAQAAGAKVYLYGSTTIPAGTFPSEIEVIDLRPVSAPVKAYNDSTNAALQSQIDALSARITALGG